MNDSPSRIESLGGFPLAMLAMGAVAGGWHAPFVYELGGESFVAAKLTILAALGTALGVSGRPRLGTGSPRAIALGLLVVGVATYLTRFFAKWAASGLVMAGASMDAGPVSTTFAHLLCMGVFVVPVSLVGGWILRSSYVAIPETESARAWAVVGAVLFALGLNVAPWARTIWESPTAVGITCFVVTIGVAATYVGRGGRDHATARSEASSPILASPDTWLAVSVGLCAGSVFFLNDRALVAITNYELVGTPVVTGVSAAMLALGALVAGLVPAIRNIGVAWAGPFAAAASVASVLTFRGSYELVGRAHNVAAASEGFGSLVAATVGLLIGPLAPVLLLGVAVSLLASDLPQAREQRSSWIRHRFVGLFLGFALGATATPALLTWVQLGTSWTIVVAVTALVATAATVASNWLVLARTGVATILAIVAIVLVVRPPQPDRAAAVTGQDFQEEVVQFRADRMWTRFDEDGPNKTVTLRARGHICRLYEDGRWHLANGREVKSHGLVANLPSLLGPTDGKAALLGSANGIALQSLSAHPFDSILVLSGSRESMKATARFGRRVRNAILDPRIEIRAGDPLSLLRRSSDRFDVIVGQLQGVWSQEAARAATAEAFELIRDRLTPTGTYAHWLQEENLSKRGFQILAATMAEVFPEIELWNGSGGDLILLGRLDSTPFSLVQISKRYEEDRVLESCQRGWFGDPISLLANRLMGSASVRRISADSPIHRSSRPQLLRLEKQRALVEGTVNPVPGLAELRDDIASAFSDLPDERVDAVLANAIQARDLEVQAKDLEVAEQPVAAAQVYKRALELNPSDGSLRRSFAMLRSEMGVRHAIEQNFLAAFANLREAIDIDNTYSQGFANLGYHLLRSEDFEFALAVTFEATTLEPDNDLYQLQMGRIWKQRGYFDKSLPWYEEAVRLNPVSVQNAVGFIDAKLAVEDHEADLEEGLRYLEPYVTLEPDNADLLLRVERLRFAIANGLTRPPDSSAAVAGAVAEPLPLLDETGEAATP